MTKFPALVLVAFLCLALPAFGALCEKCKDRSYTKDLGECSACGGLTTSGEFKLCQACSAKLGECAHCRAALAPTTDAKPAALDLERNGTYRADGWVYEVQITNEGSRSQGVVGTLSRQGVALPEPAHLNDYYVTPWGKLYWVGTPLVAFGAHGWMPKPAPHGPVGAELPRP
jgi:hypothetical protein